MPVNLSLNWIMINNIAIIGVSGYAETLLSTLFWLNSKNTNFTITAAVSRNPERDADIIYRLKNEMSCSIYTDYKQLMHQHEGQIDLCIIPTGIQFHKEMAIAALEAKMNVFLEKPVAPTLEDVDAIIACSKSNNRFVTIGFQDVYSEVANKLKTKLLSNDLGNVKKVKLQGFWPRNTNYFKRNSWAGKIEDNKCPIYDSPVMNAFAHFINLIFFCLDENQKIKSLSLDTCLKFRSYDIENFDTIFAALKIGNVQFKLLLSHATQKEMHPIIEFQCEKGTLTWEHYKAISIHEDGKPCKTIPLNNSEGLRREMFQNVFQYLNNESGRFCSCENSRRHIELVHLLQFNGQIYDLKNSKKVQNTQCANGASQKEVQGLIPVLEMLLDA